MFLGNVGNVFSIDPEMGTVNVARELDYSVMSEYTLMVKAMDSGSPALFSTIHVHIMVTMADNAPPRYVQHRSYHYSQNFSFTALCVI
jgi:protocadherin Fat 1/2/3